MAKIVTGKENVVLITTRTYSSTTASHLSMVKRATNHMTQFIVGDIDPQSKSDHEANWKDLMDRCYDCVEKARHAREHIKWSIGKAELLEQQASRYAEAFGLKHPPSHYVGGAVVALAPKIARATQLQAIKEGQNRERDRLRRIEQAKTNQEHMADWRAGANHGCMALEDGTDCIRVKGNEVETGYGAQVHLREALLLFELWKDQRTGGDKVHDLPTRIGPYEGITMSEDKNVLTIGCHQFNWNEASTVLGSIG
jgi:hypothetical protein